MGLYEFEQADNRQTAAIAAMARALPNFLAPDIFLGPVVIRYAWGSPHSCDTQREATTMQSSGFVLSCALTIDWGDL